MKSLRLLLALALLAFASALHAEVPQIINYQGRVAVGTTNFDGTGQFKFALVNAAGNVTFWSNDGSSGNGSQPTNAVLLTVTKGLYSVLLGDTTLPNMTAIPASVFNNSDVRLRVWFNDGTNGSQQLTPDQRISAVGYGAVGTNQLAAGAVGTNQLASGAAAANLAASGQSGVPSGGLVLTTQESSKLTDAGYIKIGTTMGADFWQQRTNGTPPSARNSQTSVWTGSEMIVWGGSNGSHLGDGARYNPSTNVWVPVSVSGAPAARSAHTAVWTGSEMIVWGGSGASFLNSGGRYDPVIDTWSSVTTTGAPAARYQHTAVWTGSEMIVWGGSNGGFFNDGARYNPTTNAWVPVTTTNAPGIRTVHTAVWTGSEMIIWGGLGASSSLNNGGRYNPVANSWTAMSISNAPVARVDHKAVWTGSEMIVWGGGPIGGGPINTAGR